MLDKHRSITAEDIMSDVVVTIKEKTLVRDAAHLMFRDRVNEVVVFNEQKEMVGILTMRHLFHLIYGAFGEKDKVLYSRLMHGQDLYVEEVMSRDVLTIAPSATLEEIVALIVDMHMHTFPVVREKKLVGILGSYDILNAIFNFI